MCEQVRVERFQLASFVVGIFCQKALNSGHFVTFSERFNAAMCIAWIVQTVDTNLSPGLVPKRASPPRSLTPIASCPNNAESIALTPAFKVQEFRFQPAPSFICLSSELRNPPLVIRRKMKRLMSL